MLNCARNNLIVFKECQFLNAFIAVAINLSKTNYFR